MLSANPKETARLRLDEEQREIETGLERSQLREKFRLVKKEAVRPKDFRRAMLDLKPQIVHFSGHGEGEKGIAFEDEAGKTKLVDAEALAGLFKLFADSVECVILNACYSKVQAAAIARHIPYVIGMSQAIGDQAAIEFSVGFYDALGADRWSENRSSSSASVISLGSALKVIRAFSLVHRLCLKMGWMETR
jgi:CHAT domain-containing protein